jgi:predicted dehydrogenase
MAINIALIGAGLFAKDAHIPALKKLDECFNLKAIWSKTRKSAEEAAKIAEKEISIYSDDDGLTELLTRNDIHAVDILVPPMNMASVVEKCLRAGKHVISEKPIAGTYEDAVKLYQRYRDEFHSQGLVWAINENWAFEPYFLRVRDLIQSGEVGRLVAVTCQISLHVSPNDRYFNAFWRKGTHQPGGFVTDGGVHHIAGLRVMCGEVTRVQGSVTHFKDFIPRFDTYAGTFEFTSGAIGTLLVTFAASKEASENKSIPEYIVICEKGTIFVSRNSVNIIGPASDKIKSIEWDESQAIEDSLRAFYEGISNKGQSFYKPESALKDLELASALMKDKQ